MGAVTLKEAYQAAVEKTETVPLQQAAAAQSEERITQGISKVLPNVSLLGTYTRQQPVPTGNNAFTQPDQYSARVNLVQPLFHGLGEWAELRSRQAQSRSARASVDAAKLTLYGTVADAYLAVTAAERDRENVQSLGDLTNRRIEELKGRVRIGRSRKGDLLSAEAQAAVLLQQVEAAQSAIATARETFQSVTGLDRGTVLADDAPTPPPSLSTVEQFLGRIEQRPDVNAAKENVTAAQEQISVARSGHFPSLDLSANLYLLRTGILQNSHYDFGLQFALPLFSGGGVTSTVREASERSKQQELGLAKLRREAEREVRAQYVAVRSFLEQHKLLGQALEIAEKNYTENVRDYRYGLVNNLEVLAALNTFQDTKRTHDRTRFQMLSAWAHLQAATGSLP